MLTSSFHFYLIFHIYILKFLEKQKFQNDIDNFWNRTVSSAFGCWTARALDRVNPNPFFFSFLRKQIFHSFSFFEETHPSDWWNCFIMKLVFIKIQGNSCCCLFVNPPLRHIPFVTRLQKYTRVPIMIICHGCFICSNISSLRDKKEANLSVSYHMLPHVTTCYMSYHIT